MPFWVGSVGFAKVVTIAYDNEITVLLMSARFCCLFRQSLLAVGINKIKSVGNSLDATYSFFPTENVTIKLKLMNLLDEAISIEREGVLVFEEKPGMAISASAKYDF